MSKYDVEIKRLGLLLLPTFLRQPVMAALVYAALTPLSYLHARFMQIRRTTAFRLNRNGQVCYLRAALNDTFDPLLRRITVTDTPQRAEGQFVYRREIDRAIRLPLRSAERPVIVNCRGFGGANGFDFAVNLPHALRSAAEGRLKAVADTYKLVSKRFVISYF